MSIEITQDMINLFGQAWETQDGSENVINCSEHDMGDCPYHNTPGARRRAGLTAVLNGISPDAKIALASQLLQSANEAEGEGRSL
jgi:hypothetical protein